MDDRDELSRRLWTLRELMSQLLFALEVQQLVLANDRLRWLPMVTDTIENVVDQIRTAEVDRTAVSQRVSVAHGLRPDASLAELAQVATEPHAEIWRQSREHLLSIQQEIDEFSRENQALNRRGMSTTNSLFRHLEGDSTTYDPRGAAAPLAPTASIFDRSA